MSNRLEVDMQIEVKMTHQGVSAIRFLKLEQLEKESLENTFKETFSLDTLEHHQLLWMDEDKDWVCLSATEKPNQVLARTARNQNGRLRIRSEYCDLNGVCMGPMKNTASVQDLIDVYTRIQDMYRAASNVELRLGVVHHVMIVCKPSDPFLVPLTRELTIWLLETYPHLTVFVNDTLKDEARFTAKTIQARCGNRLRYWDVDIAEREHIDLVVTLGGDGTVLYAANLFQRQVPVIVPFHLGSLGFLTVFNFDQYHLYLSTILENGGLLVNMRMRICCKVYKRPRTNGTLEPPHNVDGHLHQPTPSFAANHVSEPNGFYRGVRTPVNVFEATPSLREQRRARNQAAQNPFGSEHSRKSSLNDIGLGEMIHHIQALNELVIDRGANATMIQLDLYTDERPFTTILADGLVIATATGSTAYSLSANGSLVHPEKNSVLVTPICPHTLTCRPMIIPGTKRLRIVVAQHSRMTAWASFDGRNRIELERGDSIVVTASEYPVITVSRENQSVDWFTSLRDVLNWNERRTQKPLVSPFTSGDFTD